MTGEPIDTSAPEIEWDELARDGELTATVLMASGFALAKGQKVTERYRIVGSLGSGAMGKVLAVNLLGRDDLQVYALKVVARRTIGEEPDDGTDAQVQTEAYAELLRQEAAKQDIVQRHGVAVARLFALVQLEDGSIGMRMEVARGRSLESRINHDAAERDRAPNVYWAVIVVRKLVSQLRRLHEMAEPGMTSGFVHCDIKPGNVFVDDTDPTDLLVTLLDFGVATAGQAMVQGLGHVPSSRRTFIMQETGGTLGYAPPKHFARKATPLSDIHASIVMLYELVSLQLPWAVSETGDAYQDFLETEYRMRRGPRPVRDLRPSISVREASVVDGFFKREFLALHQLSEAAAKVFDGSDEAARAAMNERLTRLAREYQTRLDELCAQFTPRASGGSMADLNGGGSGVINTAPVLGAGSREPSRVQRMVVVGDTPSSQSWPVAEKPKERATPSADSTAALPLVRVTGSGSRPLDKDVAAAAGHPSAHGPDSSDAVPLVRATPRGREGTAGGTRAAREPAEAAPPPDLAHSPDESAPVASAAALPLLKKIVVRKERPRSTARVWLIAALAMVVGALLAYLSVRH
jgi:serine/threonine protein kinase